MAKAIIVQYKGAESQFGFTKLDRSKLYGKRRRVVMDQQGMPCERAALTRDGTLMIRAGMTGQGYYDESGKPVERKELVGIDEDGNLVERKASTLGVVQELSGPVPPDEVMDLSLLSVYILDPKELDADLEAELGKGHIFRFPFNYYADYHLETGFLLANKEGIFALIGSMTQPVWCEPDTVSEDFEEADMEDDDLDFEMF